MHAETSKLSHDDGTQLVITKQRKEEGTCRKMNLIIFIIIILCIYVVEAVQSPCGMLLQENNLKSHQKDLPLGKQGDCTNNNNNIMQIYHLWYKCGSTF